MTNIVMIARDRKKLTQQMLDSLWDNTDADSFNLTIVDDGSDVAVWDKELDLPRPPEHIGVTLSEPIGIVGFLRNLGASVTEKHFGRGDYLYFSDNDVYFKPGWLETMLFAMECPYLPGGPDAVRQTGQRFVLYAVIGGCRHPFHIPSEPSFIINTLKAGVLKAGGEIPLEEICRIETVDAVAGYSMLMRWGTWDAYGPFDAHAKGVGQSEDWALCQKAVKAGYKVGYIHPPVLVMCGLTNTAGEKVPGWEQFEMVERVVQE